MTPRQLTRQFRLRTGLEPPVESEIYRNSDPAPVRATAEYAPMGGVLISYPGTLARGDELGTGGPPGYIGTNGWNRPLCTALSYAQ
jgi:hypothetical protein